jgi:hypothetical protein
VADDIAPSDNNSKSLADFIGSFPLSAAARAELIALWTDATKVRLPQLTTAPALEAHLQKTSYLDFLKNEWKLSAEATVYLAARTLDFFGLSAQHIPVRRSALCVCMCCRCLCSPHFTRAVL